VSMSNKKTQAVADLTISGLSGRGGPRAFKGPQKRPIVLKYFLNIFITLVFNSIVFCPETREKLLKKHYRRRQIE